MLLTDKLSHPTVQPLTSPSMETQQLNSGAIESTGILNDGFATLFFMMGALHVYNAMRKRQRQLSLVTKFILNCSLPLGFVAITILGMIEIVTLRAH